MKSNEEENHPIEPHKRKMLVSTEGGWPTSISSEQKSQDGAPMEAAIVKKPSGNEKVGLVHILNVTLIGQERCIKC